MTPSRGRHIRTVQAGYMQLHSHLNLQACSMQLHARKPVHVVHESVKIHAASAQPDLDPVVALRADALAAYGHVRAGPLRARRLERRHVPPCLPRARALRAPRAPRVSRLAPHAAALQDAG